MLTMIVVAFLAPPPQVQDRVLDLSRTVADETKLTVDQPFSYDGSCRGDATGRPVSAPQLSLTIDWLNDTEYSSGERLVARLRLTNTGTDALAVPWVLRQEFRERFEGADAIQAAVDISAVDAEGREHMLIGTILRGSMKREGTAELLNPGESVSILFPGVILGTDGPAAFTTGEAKAFARIIFSDGECRMAQPVRSATVKILLKSK